ncbi:somatostatin 6 [Triplophysa dalaica]|uniref:somatostatin 6 n=1 Tax=Triplophysa dalaica TaxID=1582913 RepID=UPI0024DFB852|nr:somatostatin 6 [Triplophysa dalaica]XP_056589675.1 somatostatin 6 [Triplophysa dalaica]XP_056589676.1 somatostatin 6 [Triplophysa dalaica]
MGAGWDLSSATDRSVFMMRVLLALFPLLLTVWNSTEALPVHDKITRTNEVLTEDQKDLLKMMTDLEKMNLTSKELKDLDLVNGTLEERSFEKTEPKDKSPCKLFYWKTFSSC